MGRSRKNALTRDDTSNPASIDRVDQDSLDRFRNSHALDSSKDHEEGPRKKTALSRVAHKHRETFDGAYVNSTFNLEEEAKKETEVPFCCAVCKCSPEEKKKYKVGVPGISCFIDVDESDDYLAHRRCCHKVSPDDTTFAPSCIAAQYEVIKDMENNAIQFPTEEEQAASERIIPRRKVTRSEIVQHFKNTEELFQRKDHQAVAPNQMYMTSEPYIKLIKTPFQNLEKERNDPARRPRLKVLDIFSGGGGGVLSLMRNGLDIEKVVHVEHDLVATHTIKWNQDVSYNPHGAKYASENTNHIYFHEFEEFLKNFIGIMEEHGPFDLLLAGPPCVDYSGLNAYGEGLKGESGKFMREVADLIKTIQNYPNQKDRPLMYLIENVKLDGEKKREVEEMFLEKLGISWDPINLDSMLISPCVRNRSYWTNIYHEKIDALEKEFGDKQLNPDCCLEEDGHAFPSAILFQRGVLDSSSNFRCPTLLASKSRIDDISGFRMFVWETGEKGGYFHGRTLMVVERERLMGYPEGYFRDSVNHLYEQLSQNGLQCLSKGQDWRKSLDSKLHVFAGNYHGIPTPFKYQVAKGSTYVYLTLAPHLTSEEATANYFSKEEYAKRLIGNICQSFSIPVVQELLKPLKNLFKSKHYDSATYQFAWDREELVEYDI